eukprot:NODE_229_length_12207_cov_1.116700.p11 type:complete len:152 gc:universal NODE_229_length_12207_cov_1.116700:7185-6730(-)
MLFNALVMSKYYHAELNIKGIDFDNKIRLRDVPNFNHNIVGLILYNQTSSCYSERVELAQVLPANTGLISWSSVQFDSETCEFKFYVKGTDTAFLSYLDVNSLPDKSQPLTGTQTLNTIKVFEINDFKTLKLKNDTIEIQKFLTQKCPSVA